MNTEVSSKILDDAREKMLCELEVYTAAFVAHTESEISTEEFVLYLEDFKEQSLALSGTTDIECPDCMGQGSTFIAHPVYCPRCNHSGVLQYPWKVSVTLENGELPVLYGFGVNGQDVEQINFQLKTQNDMLNAKYRQIVE